jgi:alkyl sulfatase BDS1-like metallo-beta-lactamase superfamily hydrolase
MATPLIGTCESIERSRELIEYVADTGLHVIITGGSGVAKKIKVMISLHVYQWSEQLYYCSLIFENTDTLFSETNKFVRLITT